ncbi:magnesium-chelatase 38 kDa subunit [Methanobrevibacter cuticularis]|uniref:Magnesium-chelatase 38 kDa subunit n=1 Tax=Methanobrevibacter cuticularis TaxID=47311 RepID=A0A166DIM5_9EURY|nr:hypothetical protein [Methanobrevibacter cuticularis]KZX15641.1 magnesium-chelatase 38 kDa subunit [Methanobrevibacter cuticularis]
MDVVASRWRIIEREGISISLPSKFIIVGTVNIAERELREQLSDIIGLKIHAYPIEDIANIVKHEIFGNNYIFLFG